MLTVDNRADDILNYSASKANTELFLQKTMSAFAFALENAATENYYSNQSDIPPDSSRLLLCLNNCKYTQTKVGTEINVIKVVKMIYFQLIPSIVKQLSDIEQLSLDKVTSEALNM